MAYTFISQFFAFTRAFTFVPTFIVTNTCIQSHSQLHVSYHSIHIASLVLDIKLKTLTFKFLTTSGTHNIAYGSLILFPAKIRLGEDVLKTHFAFVFIRCLQKTFSRRLGNVLIKTNILVFVICFQDVFKTSLRRLAKTFSKGPVDAFKTSSRRLQDVLKTFSKRLQDVFKTSTRRPRNIFRTSSRRVQDVLKTSSRLF